MEETKDIEHYINIFTHNIKTLRLLFSNVASNAEQEDVKIRNINLGDAKAMIEKHIFGISPPKGKFTITPRDFIKKIENGPLAEELLTLRPKPAKNLDSLMAGIFILANNYLEYFLHDLLSYGYTKLPELIFPKSVKIKISDIINLSSTDEIKDFIVAKKKEEILEKISYDELIDEIKQTGISVETNLINWAKLKEVRERRNLIVHRKSIVDTSYIRLSANFSNLSLGEKIKLTGEYLLDSLLEIEFTGHILSLNCWKAWYKEKEITVIEWLSRILYWENVDENYQIVVKLYPYSRRFKPTNKNDTDELQLLRMHYLIALKKLYLIDQFNKELSLIDQETLSLLGKTYYNILLDKPQIALPLLKKAISEGLVNELGYNKNPIYSELRGNEEFNSEILKLFSKQ